MTAQLRHGSFKYCSFQLQACPTNSTTTPTFCALCWHKSLKRARPQLSTVRAAADPFSVVQEALVILRKADHDRLRTVIAPGLLQLGQAERQVMLVGGQPFIEDGPLASFADVIDTGARRLLPGNLLRRCKVLSTLQVSENRFQQRVATTACTGEEGVLDWTLVRHSGTWRIASIRRDPSGDFPLPEQPHPRHSPEAVTLRQLSLLKRGDLAAAARFHVYATIPRGEDASERALASILQSDHFLPILGHMEAMRCLKYHHTVGRGLHTSL